MSDAHIPAHDQDAHDAASALHHTSTGIENKKVAMWAFLGSDCMFFGTLISTHLIHRKIYPGAVDPQQIFDIELTGFSSFILLMSSFLMALSVSSAHKANIPAMRWFLAGTVFFGLIFLGGQVYEFTHFVHDKGLTLNGNIFGSTFYLLTGTHGLHVALGVLWLFSWLLASFPKEMTWWKDGWYKLPFLPVRWIFGFMMGKWKKESPLDIEVAGLYWHFVDIVWIIIFTVVYLLEYVEF